MRGRTTTWRGVDIVRQSAAHLFEEYAGNAEVAAEQQPERRRRMHARRITDLATHPDAFVTVQAFAEHLSVDQKTVMKWIKAGVLTADQFGREWGIHTADASAFVERNRYQPL